MRFSVALTIILLTAFSCAHTAFAQDTTADALAAQAVIRRDTFGVPHILAETEEAAFFAYGYAAAEDHVLTIARLYLAAKSEESFYFGPDFVESDLMTKQLRIYRGAAENFGNLTPHFQRAMNAYAMGFNRYVHKNRAALPEWVKPISGIDVLAHNRNVVIKEFCMNLNQIKALYKTESPAAQTAMAPTDFHDRGSNMWAINAERSKSGHAMLLGNPHLRWSGSHLWHEVQLTVPGEYNFLGATLVGFPGPGIGFNERLGWSHTVNPHDCDDLYKIEISPEDPNAYIYEGKPWPLQTETIQVDVTSNEGTTTVTRDVQWSHYGPIVKRDGNIAYAYKSPHFDEFRFSEQWYLMTKAKSFDEFRGILNMQALPMFNIGYADADGNCYYLCNGRFPARPEGFDWAGVVPGGVTDSEWHYLVPTAELPQLLNPKGGYIANSNSSPWYTNLNQILDRHRYPSDLFPLENTLRSQMGLTFLESHRGSFAFDDLLNYKNNERILLADRVKRDLSRLATGQIISGLNLTHAAEVLDRWDNSVSADSVGSVLFVTFWNAYITMTDHPFQQAWDEARPNSTPYGIGDDEAALKALAAAVRDIEDKSGSIEVPWGEVFRIRRGNVIDIPVGGLTTEFGAFRVIGYVEAPDGKMVAAGGDSYVFVVEFGDRIRAKSIMAYSQSENPDSPHFADQTEMFAANQWKDAWFYENEVAANTRTSYHP